MNLEEYRASERAALLAELADRPVTPESGAGFAPSLEGIYEDFLAAGVPEEEAADMAMSCSLIAAKQMAKADAK